LGCAEQNPTATHQYPRNVGFHSSTQPTNTTAVIMNMRSEQLTGVPETLLMTLYHRALETQRPDGIIRDRPAVEIVKQIDYDFTRFDDWKIQWGVAVRTELFDNVVQKFLIEHPDGLIITLGAGLCTRALRLDNQQAQWISIDLPPVQPYWENLIGASERNHFITCSVTDFTWIDLVIKVQQDRKVLFVIEGLFMYLSEDEVKSIMLNIQQNFPTAQLVVEVLGKILVKNTWLHRPVAITGSKFNWGINDCKEMETWNRGVKLLDQWYITDYYHRRQAWFVLTPYLLGGKGQLTKVAHFQLE
jgi:O-methyltransferase involved in polyketide biosynthesis